MGLLDIFSKRTKRAAKVDPDVFQYDEMPQKLRIQLVHILIDAIGRWEDTYWSEGHPNWLYQEIHAAISREHGVFGLSTKAANHADAIFDFVLTAEDVAQVLDVPEVAFSFCEQENRRRPYDSRGSKPIQDVIHEFNERCREAAFGYEYRSGRIIRIDSTLAHQTVIKPALMLLHDKQFSGANQEFLQAHEHYRHGRNKEAMVDALKSFESTIKAIAAKRAWALAKTPNAKTLIDACFSNGLLDPMLSSYLTGVRTSLESGLPTIRNQTAGHGQGVSPTAVPDYLAAFAINQAATCIIMLVEAHNNTK